MKKFGSLFSTYRRGEPGEYEYRVQVKEAGIDRLTYIAELTEFGIEEVGGVGRPARPAQKGGRHAVRAVLRPRFAHRPAEKKAALPARGSDHELFLGEQYADECVDNADECKRDRPVRGCGRDKFQYSAGADAYSGISSPACVCIVGLVDCPRGTAPRETEDRIARSRARDSGVKGEQKMAETMTKKWNRAPLAPERVEEMERYLNEMAHEGWQCCEIVRNELRFVRGEQDEYTYRVQYFLRIARRREGRLSAHARRDGRGTGGRVRRGADLAQKDVGRCVRAVPDLDSKIAALEKRRSHARNMMLGALMLVLC